MQFRLPKNGPCPCGSGKKYKKCCIKSLNSEQEEYYGLLNKEYIVKGKISKWLNTFFDEEEFDNFLEEYKSNLGVIETESDEIHFFDWLIFEAREKEHNQRIIDLIIENDYTYYFDEDELTIMQEWADNTQFSIFSVESIDNVKWKIKIKDIFSDKTYEVMDRSGSEQVLIGDILLTKLQKVFSKYFLSGSLKKLPPLISIESLKDFVNKEFLEAKKKNKYLDMDTFLNENSKLIENYNPGLNDIEINNGLMKDCKRIYTFNNFYSEKILNELAEDDSFDIVEENYRDDESFRKAKIDIITYDEPKLKKNKGGAFMLAQRFDKDGQMVYLLGTIEMKEGILKFQTNFKQYYNLVIQKIEGLLGNLIKFKVEEINDIDWDKDSEEHPAQISLKEEKEFKKQYLTQYYIDWCDKEIPALGGKTPRESLKTENGRMELNKLIKLVENSSNEDFPINPGKIIRKTLKFHN